MKRIICVLLVLVMCLGLCACHEKIIDENGIERESFFNEFGIISHDWEYNYYEVYHLQSKVVYIYREGLSPYQIYKDGVIYGAVYDNGQIVPVPYATALTLDTIDFYLTGRS